MSNIKIKITNLHGSIIEIEIDENSTIKELKKAYAPRYKHEVANIEGVPDEHNFKFVLDTEILDDNRKLNEVLTGDVLKGEIYITAIIRTLSIAYCFRAINELDLIYNQAQKLVKLEIILTEKTDEEDPSILASSDKNIVLAAVKKNGRALQYASEELKEDRELVLTAVQQNGRALQFASKNLKENREFILEAVQQNALALEYAAS
jgi:sulfur carrier protein ThiS